MWRIINTTFAILAVLLLISCSASRQVVNQGQDERSDTSADSAGVVTEQDIDLGQYRSRMSDRFTTQQNDLPEAFRKQYEGNNDGMRDPFAGFRIQIISTRNVSLADSAAQHFRSWADTTLTGYSPQAYVFFRQPYYKVHIGDFQNRERAINLSRLVKRRFPDAWVVHDRINPYLVPPDSVTIGLK